MYRASWSRAAWLAPLLVATGLRADTFGVTWTALEHPLVTGYRFHIRDVSGTFAQDVDLPLTETAFTVKGLEGECRTYCASVRARDAEGGVGPVSTEICGYADPEVYDLGLSGGKWRLYGDNLASDVELTLDDDAGPTSATRLDCTKLILPKPPIFDLRVRNVTDGVGAHWELPWPNYLKPSSARTVVVIECGLADQSGEATVTSVSYTPGSGLSVEADLPPAGSGCASAVAAALSLPEMSSSKMKLLRSPKGMIYLFVE